MPRLRNDLGLYERCAHDWWKPDSAFAGSLHGVNALAIAQVRERLGARLAGALIVDLGCGGGLVGEPLARDGARVIGVDLGERTLRVAAAHGAEVGGLSWVRADASTPPLADGCADVVLCADALEHIPGWRELVARAARLLRPGGLFYVLTLNDTWRARWIGVHLAEGLRLVPPGTHDPDLFVSPEELHRVASTNGFVRERVIGQRLRLWRTMRHWRVHMAEGCSLAIMYSVWYAKGEGPAA